VSIAAGDGTPPPSLTPNASPPTHAHAPPPAHSLRESLIAGHPDRSAISPEFLNRKCLFELPTPWHRRCGARRDSSW
jgi:hypothetical protein